MNTEITESQKKKKLVKDLLVGCLKELENADHSFDRREDYIPNSTPLNKTCYNNVFSSLPDIYEKGDLEEMIQDLREILEM